MGSKLDSYVPGDAVELKGELINQNTYPIVDGNVFARISRKNSNYTSEGNYIIDEVLLQENVALKENETKEVSYQWTIPNNSTKGDYRIDYFFSVGKKFNLGGLPFSNEVVIGATEFSIDSINTGYISFNRDKTIVNNVPYKHIGNWPTIEPNQEVIIKQPITNTHEESREINISYKLYHWDSLNQGDLRDTKTESINLNSQETKELVYTIPQMNDAVYYLQIIAQSGEDKSIVNIRVTSPQQNIRLNYPAITKFPINQGDSFTLFSCFHNGSNINTKGKIEVILKDKKDKEIGRFDYEGDITSSMLAEKAEIIANKDYDYLKLTAKTYDEKNKLTDEYAAVYDCKDFGVCRESSLNNSKNILSLNESAKSLVMIFSVVIIFVFGFVIGNILNKKNDK